MTNYVMTGEIAFQCCLMSFLIFGGRGNDPEKASTCLIQSSF